MLWDIHMYKFTAIGPLCVTPSEQ